MLIKKRGESGMKTLDLQKLIRLLRSFVLAAFVCNILALFLVPSLVILSPKEIIELGMEDVGYALGLIPRPEDDIMYFPVVLALLLAGIAVWESAYHAVLTCFLWVCGTCTAVILWQAKNVLDTMLRRTPFLEENAQHLQVAAVACFVISFAAALRTVWGFFYYRNLSPLLTYNFLFCPLFLMGGLLFLVMSALFRQASEMREENDLTI